MLVVLKIPIAYLCVVVWLAVRAEPTRGEPDALVRTALPVQPEDGSAWKPRRHVRPGSRPPRRPDTRRRPTLTAGSRR